MTKQKSTKRALLLSALSLLMCVSMLIGSTFAWFTDSVTSSGNIIKSGTLDVTMEWADGKTNPSNTDWTDASKGAIFNNDKWEPGYVEVRHIKIANEGSLALKYQLSIAAKDEVTDLTDAIDVYYVDPAVQVADRTELDQLVPIGTLTEVLANISTSASGELLEGESDIVTLALKMRESAGNEYQGKSIGSSFEVKLMAIQKDFEPDSFGPDYDEGLDPTAKYVSSAQELMVAMRTQGANILLTSDITVTGNDETGWGQHMFLANGKSVTVDLNGHNITIAEDATQIGSVFAVANSGKIVIKGNGNVEVKNGKAFMGWTVNGNGSIDVYGGNYFGNAHEGNNALFYVQTGKIDIYGGKFTYPVASDDNWGFNAHNNVGNNLVIEIHEGALLQHNTFQYGDDTRIRLSEGCTLAEVVIDGETWYKVVAVDPVSTVAEVNTALNGSDDVILANCNDATAVINVPDTYTGTLIVENSTINSIKAADAANILVRGDVTVKSTDGSAITGKYINISGEDDATLTAIADEDGDRSYGIGGDDTENISIKDVHIKKVSGGYVQKDFVNDTKYGKDEAEGGAAIGSGYSGANITLTNVVIDEALGGSKAAGIGARFWTGVNITITNCEIKKAVGGNASAGIGGSRVSQNATSAEDITITIKDSVINAEGGQFAAGIGSGYDTHCATSISVLPVTTINISGSSSITAKGGQYAAGIGTGYHTAGLEGKIEDTVAVNATAGGSREKYTQAMDVGFGVFDRTREGSKVNSASTFDYKGTIITSETAPDVQ